MWFDVIFHVMENTLYLYIYHALCCRNGFYVNFICDRAELIYRFIVGTCKRGVSFLVTFCYFHRLDLLVMHVLFFYTPFCMCLLHTIVTFQRNPWTLLYTSFLKFLVIHIFRSFFVVSFRITWNNGLTAAIIINVKIFIFFNLNMNKEQFLCYECWCWSNLLCFAFDKKFNVLN